MNNSWIEGLLFLIVAGLLVWSVSRRKTGGTNVEVAMAILSNIQDCLKTIDIRLADPQSKKKFQDSYWNAFAKKTGFLSSDLVATLNEAFSLANDLNQRIDVARKNNMMSTLQDIKNTDVRCERRPDQLAEDTIQR
jgi:hypothetical protein